MLTRLTQTTLTLALAACAFAAVGAPAADEQQQEHDRSLPVGWRRAGGRGHRHGPSHRHGASHRQVSRIRPGVRLGHPPQHGPRPADARPAIRISSASP